MDREEDLSLSVVEETLSRRPRRRREALLRGASARAWGIETGRSTTGSQPLGGSGRRTTNLALAEAHHGRGRLWLTRG
jgi:hypothetical protein